MKKNWIILIAAVLVIMAVPLLFIASVYYGAFFGFLFGSVIIHNHEFAGRIFQRYNSILGSAPDIKSFNIYFEVAALRDYWHNLGRSDEYN